MFTLSYYYKSLVGGEFIQVEFPIPADVDPAYWVPDEKALEIYQSADLILANGADYAKWMNNVSLPSSRIVNTSKGKEDLYIELKNVSTHSHGPEGKHEHTRYAFTTWLNFELAAVQAEAIKNALVRKIPANELALEKNFKSLQADLLGLHKKMTQTTKEIEDKHMIGSHPVYQYQTAAYGIKIHSVHFEPNEMPGTKQWKEIPHLLDQYPANIMLWEVNP